MRSVKRAVEIAGQRPLHVICNHQIQLAVAIVIYPGCAGGKFIWTPQACSLRDFRECTVPVVIKKMTLPQRTEEQIVVAVVVVIADSNTQAKHGDSQARLSRHVGECAVVIVAIKLGRGSDALVTRPIFTIHQQNVWPAVIVKIDEGAARTHGFRQIFFSESAVVVNKMDAGLSGNVTKPDLLGVGANGCAETK